MSKRNARLRCKGMLSSRPGALAGITALSAISLLGQEKAQKDTSREGVQPWGSPTFFAF
jgi:hypothetical protein